MVKSFGQKTATQQIENVAKNDPSLTSLDLTKNASFCMKSAENTIALSEALAKNTVMTQLVLRECGIDDNGAEALGKALESNHTLEELDLQHNHITTHGVTALCAGLAKNKGVSSLNLMDQAARFGDDCVEAFINVFQTNITIVKIQWKIDSVRTWELAKLITRNVELQKKQKKGEDISILLPKALGGSGGSAAFSGGSGGGGSVGGGGGQAQADASAASGPTNPPKEIGKVEVSEKVKDTMAATGASGYKPGKEFFADKKAWDGDGVPLEESNCAGIGSDEDKALRKKAAQTEPAWQGVGLEPGLWVWRIEDFEVVPWPKEKHGKFHVKDSYIVLSVEGGEEDEPLERNIHFWLGKDTAIDQRGVAAYKTVELDDFFDGGCTQSREVMKKESEEFQELFPKMQYLKGGAESGFNPAQPDVYLARLIQVRKTKKEGIQHEEVTLERSSLNHRDCFILDNGETLYAWYGDEANAFVKAAAAREIEEMAGERPTCEVKWDVDETFWSLIGGEPDAPITPANEVDDDEEPDFGDGILFKVFIDEERKIEVEQVGRRDLDRSMLDPTCVMMLDTRTEIFMWLGKQASELTKRNAQPTALQYLRVNNRDIHTTAVHVFKDGNGMKNKTWARIFPKK